MPNETTLNIRRSHIAAGVAAALMLAGPSALAETPSKPIELPELPLERALFRVGEEYNVSVVAPDELVEGRQAPQIVGDVTALEAVRRLIVGSGLVAREVRGGAILIEVAQTDFSGGDEAQRPGRSLEDGIEELIVTARYRDADTSFTFRSNMDLKEAPLSVGIVSSEALTDRRLLNEADALETIPSVARGAVGRNIDNYTLRGSSTSALNINGLPSSSRASFDSALVDSFQVLLGPATILVGATDPGGAINQALATAKADEFVRINLELGSFEFVRGVVDANGQLPFEIDGRRLDGRLVGVFQNAESAVDGESLGRFALMPSLGYAYETGHVDLTAWVQREDGARSTGIPLFDENQRFVGNQIDDSVGIFGPGSRFERDDYGALVTWDHSFVENLSLEVKAIAQEVDALQSASYAYAYYGIAEDGTVDVLTTVSVAEESYLSGEASMVYRPEWWGQENELRIGVAATERDEFFDGGYTYNYGAGNVFNPVNNIPVDYSQEFTFERESDGSQLGAFAQAVIRPFDGLLLLGAFRSDRFEERRAAFSSKDTADTFRVGASLAFTEQITGFLSYATGFQPQFLALDGNGDSLPPETSEGLEFGLKSKWLDERLSAELTAYRIVRADVARFNPLTQISETIGEIEFQGVELNIAGDIGGGLSLVGGVAINDAEITDDPDLNRQGNRPFNTPDYTGNLWVRYEPGYEPLQGVYAGLGLVAVGRRFLTDEGRLEVPSHERWDLSVGYRGQAGHEVRLFVRNLLDDNHIESPGFVGGYNLPVAPRSINVSYSLEF